MPLPSNIASCCTDEEIRRLRGFKAEVQADLYYLQEVTKLPGSTISNYLRGRRPCPADVAAKIKAALLAWEKIENHLISPGCRHSKDKDQKND